MQKLSMKERLAAAMEKFSSFVARTTQTQEEAFRKCQDLFGFIQCSWRIINQDKTAYVRRLGIAIDQKWIDAGGMKMFVELMMHEMGHPYFCPGPIRNHVEFSKLANKKLGTTLDNSLPFVHELLNTVYDIIDDTQNQIHRKGDIEYQNQILYSGFEKEKNEDFSDIKRKAGAVLLAYPEAIVGKFFTGCKFPDDVRDAADRSVAIASQDVSLHVMVDKILDIMIPFFLNRKQEDQDEQDGDGDGQPGGKGKGKGKGPKQAPPTPEQLAQLSQQIKEARKNAGKGNAPVQESLSEDPEGSIMAGIDMNDPDAIKIAGGYMGYGPELMAKALLKQKALNMLSKFMLEGRTPGAPNAIKVGSLEWNTGHKIEQLDIIKSILHGGSKIIPGVTTVQQLRHPFPGTQKAGRIKKLAMSVDVSGSMDKDATILFIYALGLWAQKHGIETAANIWSNFEKFYPWTYKMNDRLDTLWGEYGETGVGTSVSGLKNLRGKLAKDDVLFYVTDFCTTSSAKEEARKLLTEFKGLGVKIVFLAMFPRHEAKESGFPFFEVPSIEQLPGVALEIMDALNK